MVSYMSNDHKGKKQFLVYTFREEIVHSLELFELLTESGSQKVGLVKMKTRKNDLPILFVFCQYN